MSLLGNIVEKGELAHISVVPYIIDSTSDVKSLNFRQRMCFFDDEVFKNIFKGYYLELYIFILFEGKFNNRNVRIWKLYYRVPDGYDCSNMRLYTILLQSQILQMYVKINKNVWNVFKIKVKIFQTIQQEYVCWKTLNVWKAIIVSMPIFCYNDIIYKKLQKSYFIILGLLNTLQKPDSSNAFGLNCKCFPTCDLTWYTYSLDIGKMT